MHFAQELYVYIFTSWQFIDNQQKYDLFFPSSRSAALYTCYAIINLQRDVQEHELALIREYESKLIARESEDLLRALLASTAQSAALGRVSNTLRLLMRVLNGEDDEVADTPSPEAKQGDVEEFDFEEKKDWSLERDCELARLERENSVLRRMLGMELHEIEADTKWNVTDYAVDNSRLLGPRSGSSKHPHQPLQPQKKVLGGAPGTVGPYGTYKKGKSG